MADSLVILTILGTIIGIYTILPDTKKFRLGYSIGSYEKWILIISAFSILTQSLLYAYQSHQDPRASIPILTFQVNKLFIVDLGISITAIVILGTILKIFFDPKGVIQNIEYFTEKMEELWQKKHYTTFFSLIQENYEQMFHGNQIETNLLLQYADTKLNDDLFTQIVVRYQPYLGLRIALDSSIDLYSKNEYIDSFFKALLQNKSSRLHYEIGNSQNSKIDYSRRYEIGESNKILYSLLSDIRVSVNIAIWKPIGEGVIEILDEQRKKEYDEYNMYQQKYSSCSKELYANPVFAGITFFDLMVTEALYQKISWHMWLYYYAHFVTKICRNYRESDLCEQDYEFPNTYALMLNQIIHNLIDWIQVIEDDVDKIEHTLENQTCDHENGNIIKSSVICLSQCIRKIVISENVPDQLKMGFAHSCFSLYFDLSLKGGEIEKGYAAVFKDCITSKYLGDDNYSEYIGAMLGYLERFDTVPYEFEKDGRETIKSLQSTLHHIIEPSETV